MRVHSILSAFAALLRLPRQFESAERRALAAVETHQLLLGRVSAEILASRPACRFAEIEFKVFSQWGDDGIIQWLLRRVAFPSETFVEFGVEDYRESNTRFLLQNNCWHGLVFDANTENVARIRSAEYFWKHDLTAHAAFITAENIDGLITSAGFKGEIGILHIDLDGNDYWVWRAIESITPRLVIMEYNAVFGPERTITIPYFPTFARFAAHPSGIYAGASLGALRLLARNKGYVFIGCNSAGNNAYFLRADLISPELQALTETAVFVDSRFRESRDASGRLTFVRGADRASLIQGLPVIDVATNRAAVF